MRRTLCTYALALAWSAGLEGTANYLSIKLLEVMIVLNQEWDGVGNNWHLFTFIF